MKNKELEIKCPVKKKGNYTDEIIEHKKYLIWSE